MVQFKVYFSEILKSKLLTCSINTKSVFIAATTKKVVRILCFIIIHIYERTLIQSKDQ